jgi:aspartate racemase
MKTLGLIGGMSRDRRFPCYRLISQTVAGRLGGLHSPKRLLHRVRFAGIERPRHAGERMCPDALADAARA